MDVQKVCQQSKYKELAKLAKGMGLKATGTKAVLCKRITAECPSARTPQGKPYALCKKLGLIPSVKKVQVLEKEVNAALRKCQVKRGKCKSCLADLRTYLIACSGSKQSCKNLKAALMGCLRMTAAEAERIVRKLLDLSVAKVVRAKTPETLAPPPPPPPAPVLMTATTKPPKRVRSKVTAKLAPATEQKRTFLQDVLRGAKLKKVTKEQKQRPKQEGLASAFRKAITSRRAAIDPKLSRSRSITEDDEIWGSSSDL